MYLTGHEKLQANPEKGLKLLRESADEENPLGQTTLGMAHLHGRGGLSPNPLKAMELLIRAADHGWADAQLALGRLFMGTSITQSVLYSRRDSDLYLTILCYIPHLHY